MMDDSVRQIVDDMMKGGSYSLEEKTQFIKFLRSTGEISSDEAIDLAVEYLG